MARGREGCKRRRDTGLFQLRTTRKPSRCTEDLSVTTQIPVSHKQFPEQRKRTHSLERLHDSPYEEEPTGYLHRRSLQRAPHPSQQHMHHFKKSKALHERGEGTNAYVGRGRAPVEGDQRGMELGFEARVGDVFHVFCGCEGGYETV